MRWHGKLGFVDVNEEGTSGIYSQTITERDAYGDQESRKMVVSTATQPNGVIRFNTTLSVLVNPYLSTNYDRIAYATINGVKWAVDAVDFTESKRITLQLGERYIDKAGVPSGTQDTTGSSGGSSGDNWWE